MLQLHLRSIRLSQALRLIFLSSLAGCGPSAPALPEVDPQAAASEAMRLYDTDSDGRLNADELNASPALKSALKQFDKDSDGNISGAELETRLQKLYELPVSFTDVQCTVTRGGRPLSSAEVRFVPEPFLGESLQVATAVTDETGAAQPGVSPEYLPENLKELKMMQVGLYRVEVKHPSITNAAKQSIGFEIDPARRGGTEALIEL